MTTTMVDYDKFRERCFNTKEEILALGEVHTAADGGKYTFIDNGANVLAVAHMDFVYDRSVHFHHIEVEGRDYVFCPRLDDRIGIYAIVDLLPSLGFDFDILITDDEETGKSTAKHFKTEKTYNWMFQFDRRNGDVVHYQYGTEFLKSRLQRAGWSARDIQHGSASDICKLEHLGCCGFNVGTGYQDEHNLWSSADMDVFESQIHKFATFYSKFSTLHFKYEKPVYTPPSTPSSFSYYDRQLPEGGSYTLKEGYEWSTVDRCYMPIKKKPSTNQVPTCVGCHRLILSERRSEKFSNVCLNCEAEYFICIGCGKGHKVNTMKDDNLCQACYSYAQSYGDRSLLLVIECVNKCGNALTLSEYKAGLVCSECTWVEGQLPYFS